MLIGYKRGQTSVVLRVKILDSSATTGEGLTGLTSASSGLIVSTIADNEATATAYTVAAGNVETITTLGTYAAPTSGKCRFKEVDATNHPGVYEIHLADARFAVSSAKSLLVSVLGATDCAETDLVVPLRDLDPYDSVRAGLTALPNAAAAASGGLPTVNASNRVKADMEAIDGQDTDGNNATLKLKQLHIVNADANAIHAESSDSSSCGLYALGPVGGIKGESTTDNGDGIVGTASSSSSGSGAGLKLISLQTAGAGLSALSSNLSVLADKQAKFLKGINLGSSGSGGLIGEMTYYDLILYPASVPTTSTFTIETTDEARMNGQKDGLVGYACRVIEYDGEGQVRTVTGYDYSTRTVTVDSAFTTPITTSSLIRISAIPSSSSSGSVIADSLGTQAKADVNAEVVDVLSGGVTLSTPIRPAKNTAYSNFMFPMYNSTTKEPISGLSITAERAIDGNPFSPCSNPVVELSDGAYRQSWSAADLNGDKILFKFTATGADTMFITIFTQ